ncbi:hypothetical protein [Fretibacter rubidus]|uniref:hypothetical protein n=1 Tax=Fretibacter rubidus TaxID=570162 RepID=UPI00352B4CF1
MIKYITSCAQSALSISIGLTVIFTVSQQAFARDDVATPMRHKAVISAFESANTALDNQDGQALRDAAERLSRIGAHPLRGTEDMTRIWTVKAERFQRSSADVSPPFRGRVKGAAYRQDSVAAGATLTLDEIYFAAERAELTLKPLGQNDAGLTLEMVVTDPAGDDTALCQKVVKSQTESCAFTPLFTGKYRIDIINNSAHEAGFLFITN